MEGENQLRQVASDIHICAMNTHTHTTQTHTCNTQEKVINNTILKNKLKDHIKEEAQNNELTKG